MASPDQGRSLSSLLLDLTQGLAVLFRQELELARVEMSEKADQAKAGLAEIATGALIMFVGLQALAAAAIIGLSAFLEWWLAALVVGLAVLAVGGLVLGRGLQTIKADNLAPDRTLTALKDNARWARGASNSRQSPPKEAAE